MLEWRERATEDGGGTSDQPGRGRRVPCLEQSNRANLGFPSKEMLRNARQLDWIERLTMRTCCCTSPKDCMPSGPTWWSGSQSYGSPTAKG